MRHFPKTQSLEGNKWRREGEQQKTRTLSNKINIINVTDKFVESCITLIKELSTDSIIIVINDDTEQICTYLKNNNYIYYRIKRDIFEGSEQQMIMNVLVGSKCNNIYIGSDCCNKIFKNCGIDNLICSKMSDNTVKKYC